MGSTHSASNESFQRTERCNAEAWEALSEGRIHVGVNHQYHHWQSLSSMAETPRAFCCRRIYRCPNFLPTNLTDSSKYESQLSLNHRHRPPITRQGHSPTAQVWPFLINVAFPNDKQRLAPSRVVWTRLSKRLRCSRLHV